MNTLDARADDLDRKLSETDMDESIAILVKDGKRRKTQLRILTVSLILDIFLTIGLAVLSIQTQHLAIQSDKNGAALKASCRLGNEFRTTNASLWDHVLNVEPVAQTLTPEQEAQRQKTLKDFRAYLNTVFATRDCDKIVKK